MDIFEGAKASGKVCYPTDSNQEQRNNVDNGEGKCKEKPLANEDQDYVCNGNDCLMDKSKCQCDYNKHPGETVGDWIVANGSGECGKIR